MIAPISTRGGTGLACASVAGSSTSPCNIRLGLAMSRPSPHRDAAVLDRCLGADTCRGQPEELRDVIGRGNPDVEHERSRRAACHVARAGRERRAVRHIGDGVGVDHLVTGLVEPHLARIAVDLALRRRRRRQSMHVGPLLEDFARVRWHHGRVGAAVPDRDARPRPVVARRRAADQIAPLARRTRRTLKHALERLLHVAGRAVGQARDDGAAGEHLRIAGQHRRGHRAARRQPGDEHAAAVDAVIAHHPIHHGADRGGFAAVAPGVAGLEPVEAAVRIVRPLLLGKQQRKAITLGQRRPSGAVVVARRGLAAAMQHHDQRAGLGQRRRDVGEHPQVAGIGRKVANLDKRRARGPPAASRPHGLERGTSAICRVRPSPCQSPSWIVLSEPEAG